MTDIQFDKLIAWLEIKFAAIDERFDRLEARFDRLEARFDALHNKMMTTCASDSASSPSGLQP